MAKKANAKLAARKQPGVTKPLYAQVEEIIRQRLIDNYWNPGEALPSEMQLAAELGVSQGTVRKALNDMVAENLLVRRQGRGTFVSEHTERRALFLYFNLVGADGARTMPVSRVLSCEHRKATPDERARLELAAGAKIVTVRRVRSLLGEPAIVDQVSVPQALFPNLGGDVKLPENLYRFYQGEYGITIAKAEERVRAVSATPEEADLLGLEPGAPLLEIDRIALTLDKRPVEWRLSRCNTGDFTYVAERG
ncbi:MAG: GntR family transcriptional regulator [Alphaproteobacteria bacterium]|nr:GntR family transcriptional regulator [Alphaproteobacteria bacterium]